ncbi:MAG: hypothetical protein JW940_22730 [Polyangiaceae bacterium]|nr:hypothetical protein [Polyangiaceae bacterium]
MRTNLSSTALSIAMFGVVVCWGCGTSSEGGDNSGGAASPSGGSVSDGSGGGPAGSGGASTTVPAASGGATSSGGGPGSGGSLATGGSATGGGSVGSGGRGRGGASAGTGGAATGGTATGGEGTGGATAQGGATASGDDCTVGAWAAADPSVTGPFTVTTEEEVGPEAGEAEDGVVPRFTLFRPTDMKQSGLCHPVITWGNGTGSTPTMYGGMLRHFASHGFVVIGSNSKNVARGDPKPMVVGVTWVLEQNEDPSSALYHRIDATHIGATGHSQGAMATSQACGDEHITTCVPIEGASAQRNLHGPAMFFCGGQDTLVGCSGAQSALAAVTDLPAMYAEHLSSDHGSWMSFGGNRRSDSEIAFTAWMRVHLMGDDSLRSWFYGASCTLCTDSAWQIDRKNMDQ